MPDKAPAAPLLQTLIDLAALSRIRGDRAEQALLLRAIALTRALAIRSDVDLRPLVELPPEGADAEVLRRLRNMHETGSWVLLESSIADLPSDLRWLFESGALTLEQLASIHEHLGVTSAADLRTAVGRRAVRHLPGLSQAEEAAIQAALPRLRDTVPRLPLGRALSSAERVIPVLTASGAAYAEPVGSLRRGHEMVGDVEIVAPIDDPAQAFEEVLRLPETVRCLHRSARKLYVLMDRVQVGIRSPHPDSAGAALLTLTGSAGHIDQLAALAAARGWSLDPDGLRRPDGTSVAVSEEAIYDALGLPWIPAEIRAGDEEIARASQGTLPTLVSRSDIRGDLHMHSRYSDGRDSVETMVRACAGLGYQYVAITDHSPHSAGARSLSADAIARQADEIAALRERFPQIAILHGCEADILADGRLDFPDRTLEKFDIVLASLHEGGRDGPEQLLQRYLAAMQHPLVTMITHPTNRLLPFRSGYDLDYDHLFAASVETGTVVEIDGGPAHLDLSGPLARRAIAAGATVAIDSDCHRADMLDRQMRMGIATARRGWVEPRHVLNARPVDDVRALVAAKRRGSPRQLRAIVDA